MRVSGVLAATAILTVMAAGVPAQAGLIGSGNSVQALFHYFDTLGMPPLGQTVIGEPEVNPPTRTPLTSPVTIPAQAIADSDIGFTNTQITITNQDTAPFCSVTAASCPAGEFWAFEFQFSSGIDITDVSLDAASAPDFPPTGTGIQLLSPTDVEVEVTNDNPAVGSALILDLTFGVTPPPPVPEPASLALLGVGLLGMCAVGMRPRRRRG